MSSPAIERQIIPTQRGPEQPVAATDADTPAPASSSSGRSARPRLAALDGLRFVAALAVALTHYVGLGGHWWHADTKILFPHIQFPASYGFFGVELFFLISGFVICMSSWARPLSTFFVS